MAEHLSPAVADADALTKWYDTWTAMLREVAQLATALGDPDEWHEADDATLNEEFDPWDTLRKATTEVAALRQSLASAAARETALRSVVENFALVERHTETRSHGQQDLYRMPIRGASWFDTRAAAVADWLAGLSPSPSEPAR